MEKQKEIYDKLKKQHYELVIKELNAAVIEWDHKTGSFYSSESYKNYAISKLSADDVLNNNGAHDMIHPEDNDEFKRFIHMTSSGNKKTEVILRLKMSDESYHWCIIISLYYRDEHGNPSRTVRIIIDINKEHERNVMLSSLMNFMPGGVSIWKFGNKMECSYFSDGFAKMAGISREQMDETIEQDKLFSTLIYPEDAQRIIPQLNDLTARGEPLNMMYRYIYADGSKHWLHLSGIKLREENGDPVYYCMFTNPTTESELYRSIVNDSAVGVFVIDRNKKKILYSNSIAREYAEIPEGTDCTGLNILEYLKSIGKQPLLSEDERCCLKENEYYEFHADRGEKYFSIKARALKWNECDSYIIYMNDETQSHNHMLELQKLINKVPGGIGIYEINDGQPSAIYLNDAYYKILGVERKSRKQFLGYKAIDAVYSEDRVKIRQGVRKLVEGENQVNVLHRVCNKNGKWIWLNLAASVVERRQNFIKIYASFTDCDELVCSQQKLEKKQLQEKALLSAIPGGVAIYRLKKNYVLKTDYVSIGLAKMCGYEQNEFAEYLRNDAMVNVYKEDIPMIMEATKKSIENKTPVSITYHIYAKSGQTILIRTDANLMDKNELNEDDIAVWYAVHTKVSADAQIALKEQVHYRCVLDMLGIAYWEWSVKNGFYTSENYLKYALSACSPDDVRERKILDEVVHPDDIPVLRKYFTNDNKSEKTITITLRMLMTDGSYQWTELISFADYSPAGDLIRRSGTLRNVNDEWIKQRSILQSALNDAKKANSAKTAFLSRVSHDMRTPLNGILGLAGLMRERITDKKVLHDLSQLEVSGQYLLNLINDTLDVSRIESGNMELHPSVCDGKAIFESVVSLAMPVIEEKHIHIQQITSGLTYPMLYIDTGRVEQIMLNVLGNAAKFTHEGGHISCSMTNISIRNGIITDEICIRDDGIGISSDFLPHIFEPFSQEDSSKKNSKQGTGLGMMITKQLLELMGGTISITSELGKGTCVTFTLVMPIATQKQIAESNHSEKITNSNTALSGKRILLCEDHPLNAQIATRLLRKKGITIDHAENGRIGVEMFSSSDEGYYDAILMDIRMPEMDGIEASKEIRKLSRKDALTIPIIAMTANALDEDVEQTREAGMNAHLSKPIQPDLLYEALGKCFT